MSEACYYSYRTKVPKPNGNVRGMRQQVYVLPVCSPEQAALFVYAIRVDSTFDWQKRPVEDVNGTSGS